MKSFLVVVLVGLVMESISAQAIRGVYPGIIESPVYGSSIIPGPAIIQPSSVAASLADTLSLLTVSSLLAETLPLGPNVVVSPGYGCGCGFGGYGYGGIYY